jgi:hypothetical protein
VTLITVKLTDPRGDAVGTWNDRPVRVVPAVANQVAHLLREDGHSWPHQPLVGWVKDNLNTVVRSGKRFDWVFSNGSRLTASITSPAAPQRLYRVALTPGTGNGNYVKSRGAFTGTRDEMLAKLTDPEYGERYGVLTADNAKAALNAADAGRVYENYGVRVELISDPAGEVGPANPREPELVIS